MSKYPEPLATFCDRHIGPSGEEVSAMLKELGCDSAGELIAEVVPPDLLTDLPLDLPEALSESAALGRLRDMMSQNEVRRSFIGCGYYDTLTPSVIQRCVLENPGWYTAYTPYQAEISQGRLEALLNFQTLICELTAMPVANASLLDEATAAAEAISLAAAAKPKGRVFFVSERCFPQTIDVLKTRAEPLDHELIVGDPATFDFDGHAGEVIGMLLQVPDETGAIDADEELVNACHEAGGLVVVAADLLALALLRPPGAWGADIVVGSAQRFGVPLGFGGPHAAYMACSDALKRRLPGRLVGVSRDEDGRPALRLSLQTREQHIRREKATSNICTAQVLLAVMAGFYGVYHGPEGLRRIAEQIHAVTSSLAQALKAGGFAITNATWFDTLTVSVSEDTRAEILSRCGELGINLRDDKEGEIGISIDEVAVSDGSWVKVLTAFGLSHEECEGAGGIPDDWRRREVFLQQPVFHRYRTETELLRYIRRLEGKDIALNCSMIPLGSCTMKLNAASEMLPLSWATVGNLHPFAPESQTTGYLEMIHELEHWLAVITGFDAVSLQPNAGSQGEYAGLLAIRRFYEAAGDENRDVCLIPMSAHGTNPASAVMAGFRVVPVRCDDEGNIDVADLEARVTEHAPRLAALMITYPSTHGVFESSVASICETVHDAGGQVYMDGANLNAQVGLCSPGSIGADVCHLNLHKTFCIPHGGGGPGVGPIGVAAHLAPYLPGHREWKGNERHAVSAAPWGSASILTISWMYIAMMGPALRRATEVAILNANYIAKRLDSFFPVLYRGEKGRVAHECIIDVRGFKESAGIEVEDIAKRLIDYGFHAPTMSWPVAGTLMIEPTESESKGELDRFCEAMIQIHAEISEVIEGRFDAQDNPLKHAPHPAETLLAADWSRAYSPEVAAYPLRWVRDRKFWPPVSRIDNVYGDRNLVCTCEGMDAYETE
ncbi:MAG: aminomethyl-transferring glycine dehydrogenase [Verrucomicrobiales bacterium]|nr:aminomethyl-transferring glycine dehydrogenase [Verrucomicrobiales bacterium]